MSQASIQVDDITNIQIVIFQPGQGNGKKPFYQMHLNMNGDSTLSINIKPYSVSDLALLLQTITTKNSRVILNDLASELQKGNIGPIVRRGSIRIVQWALLLGLATAFLVLVRAILTR
ncbi:hypothetical protein KKG41_03025 [Patescibacteria group bacterium]|nr:hypothetical protein [Patescibacteria group bacterium]MBU1890474.1 hypothetical protein [Patescibacteria group bacterium]